MAKQFADHRQALPAHGSVTGESMPQIVKPEIPEAGGIANMLPAGANGPVRTTHPLVPENPRHFADAGMLGKEFDRLHPEPDRAGPRLAVT